MNRIFIVDTYYQDFLNSWDLYAQSTYEAELQRLLYFFFGTGDGYSRNLRALGWETQDVIANFAPLQERWSLANGTKTRHAQLIVLEQIEAFKPDVVFLQDLSFLSNASLDRLKGKYLLAGQCSCQMPDTEKVRMLDIAFTSFPFYLNRFENLGVKAHYLPLAFEQDVLVRLGTEEPERDLDCVFIGGLGWQWKESLPLLEMLACEIPSIQFWGYGYETLPAGSPIRAKHQGPVWGLHMYRLLRRAKIVVNRHGAISGRYANNLRLFEASGCGALLLTDQKDNLIDLFSFDEAVSYRSPEDAWELIEYYLKNLDEGRAIAKAGQKRTLTKHTYAQRMPVVSEALKECLKKSGTNLHYDITGVCSSIDAIG